MGQSNNANQILSLPQGGGALSGIGETFSPELHTGTGNFTVPITLPSGRNGFQPDLQLTYSTGNGNGPFGLGWNLTISSISRKTAAGVPTYDDAGDTFLLSGAEDLVPVTRTAEKTVFRPRTEGMFARIEHYHDALNNYWRVWGRDGLTSFYGTPRPADAAPDWQDPAVIAAPADRSKIFTWQLSRTEDLFGNCIEYDYWRDHNQTGPHQWDQLYLQRIRYVDYEDSDGTVCFLVSVTFDYGDLAGERVDAFSSYRSGFAIRTRCRCERILIQSHAVTDQLIRTYELSYDNTALNRLSLLAEIRVIGWNGNKTQALPPLTFGYTEFELEKREFLAVAGSELPMRSLAHADLELVDLFGNGLPDIIQMNGAARYWRNLGHGCFDRPRSMPLAPAGVKLSDPHVQMMDANGNGRADLLVNNSTLAGYYPTRHSGEWDRRSFQSYPAAPSFSLADPEVKLVDLNGDGVTDAIRSGTRLECFFQDQHDGWSKTRHVPRRSLSHFPNINFSDPRLKWADMSGDGLQDIVLVYDGNIDYWPNLGHGDWGPRVTMRHCPRFPWGYDPQRILVGDVDGDGVADLLYVDHGRLLLWINQSGNGWSDPLEVAGTPPITNMDAVQLVDLLGTGVPGLLWSHDANGQGRPHLHFLDFTGGVKPYLLHEMNNHSGAVTRIAYAPSTRYYLADQEQRHACWQTPLPFPVQVVARVETIDLISGGKMSSEYSYHHGYWDGADREFRGFGMVEQRDTETFADYNAIGLHGQEMPFTPVDREEHFSPPTLTKSWFHQGPVGDEFGGWQESDYSLEFWPGAPSVLARPSSLTSLLAGLPRRARRDALRARRGSLLRTELYALDGTPEQERPYTVTEMLYGLREIEPPPPEETDRARIFFPHLLAQRTTQWERGTDPRTQIAFTNDYDEYGQPRQQTHIAVPRGRDYQQTAAGAQPYLAIHSLTEYAYKDETGAYFVSRVAQATEYEIVNDGRMTLFELYESIVQGTAVHQPIGQTINYYDGPAFVGLPFRQLGQYGVLARVEQLILTEALWQEAYQSGATPQAPPGQPPYMEPGTVPAWPDEYPAAFRDSLPPLAGYTFYHGAGDHEQGYFSTVAQKQYDFHTHPSAQGRGLLVADRDPLGHEMTISYDDYRLLPTSVTDPAGLVSRAEYDYRVLQIRQVTDVNGNRAAYTFTPLGLLASTAVLGRPGENVGDMLAEPGTRLTYDFMAFVDRGEPISVATSQRVYHAQDKAISPSRRNETIETVIYSDGFSRVLQTRTQAADVTFGDPVFGGEVLPADQAIAPGDAAGQERPSDAPVNVVVSGWQTYDNKGRVVEKYEPFFAGGWTYAPVTDAQRGQKTTLFYDPLGRAVRTLNPDGSEQLVVYGIPHDLSYPEQFAPTPWESYTYDANDNAGRSHGRGDVTHWNTPASIEVDALGRAVKTVARNGIDPADWHTTRATYDIRGNLLTVTDALGRQAFRYVYDLANNVLRTESIDAGLQHLVIDAAGNVVEQRDSKGALLLTAFDALNRPTRAWACDGENQPVTLRQRLIYGDSPEANLSQAQAQAANLLGALYCHYDEAGLLKVSANDWKGNVLEKTRQVIGDEALLRPLPDGTFSVDWQPPAGVSLADQAAGLLDPAVYITTLTYDALNRPTSLRYPEDVAGERKELRPYYNRAGFLERVELNGEAYVTHIAYNARGQRALIAYGNDLLTRYAYHPQTMRLARLRTERYTATSAYTYSTAGAPLQDLAYAYDLAGNMTTIFDRTPGSGIPNTVLGTDALERTFNYDPLYRLLSATGRECDAPPPEPWLDQPRCTDPTRTRPYSESYDYDPAGNLTRLRHTANGNSFTRDLEIKTGSNRLRRVTIGAAAYNYAYDAAGNMLRETASRSYRWDYANRLAGFRQQAGNSEPSVQAVYLYDATGQRVKKLVRKQGGTVETTVYIDGIFEAQQVGQTGQLQANNTLHVMDDQKRIAQVRVGPALNGDGGTAVQYHLADHLGSSTLVADDSGNWTNREEFTPYGEPSFGGFARKRYRFTGQERDEESGLNYHSARYYAAWLGRWMSPDPIGLEGGMNQYVYASDNPLKNTDPTGTQDASTDNDGTHEKTASQHSFLSGFILSYIPPDYYEHTLREPRETCCASGYEALIKADKRRAWHVDNVMTPRLAYRVSQIATAITTLTEAAKLATGAGGLLQALRATKSGWRDLAEVGVGTMTNKERSSFTVDLFHLNRGENIGFAEGRFEQGIFNIDMVRVHENYQGQNYSYLLIAALLKEAGDPEAIKFTIVGTNLSAFQRLYLKGSPIKALEKTPAGKVGKWLGYTDVEVVPDSWNMDYIARKPKANP